MKKGFLIIGVILIVIGMQNKVDAQLIYKADKLDKAENYYYLPTGSVSSKYNIWTEGIWAQERLPKSQLDKNIKSIINLNYTVRKKGNRLIEKRRKVSTYDKSGRMIEENNFRKGKEKQHHILEFNKNGFFTDYKRFARGNKKTHEILSYNKDNNVLVYENYKRGKFKNKQTAHYNDSLIVSQCSYSKDTLEVLYRWEYDYYKTNEQKETRRYKKEKLKHKWSYTCDEEGKEIKSKHESKICELKQYNNDGTYVVVKRTTGKKGKINKIRSTYDKKDRLILREEINAKNKITYKYASVYGDNDKVIAWYYYYGRKRSDEINFGYEYKYDGDNRVEEKRISNNKVRKITSVVFNTDNVKISSESKYLKRNGQLRFSSKQTYNDQGQIVSSLSKKSDGSQRYRMEYVYMPNGLLKQKLHFNKKNILVLKEEKIYQYY